MTLRLPKVHQIPHMHSWADELLAQDTVSATDAHALAYSVENHGLDIDPRIMDKVRRVQDMVGTTNEETVTVDANSHLNADTDDQEYEKFSKLSQDIENLADRMQSMDDSMLDTSANEALLSASPAPKLVEARGRRGRGKRT